MEETHSLACGFPPMACIGPMAPMPPTGAPVGRGPMPMAPGPPPTPVRLVRAFMGSSRRDNRQYYAAPTCTAEIMNTMSLEVTAEDRRQQRKTQHIQIHLPGPPRAFLSVNEIQVCQRFSFLHPTCTNTQPPAGAHINVSDTHGCL